MLLPQACFPIGHLRIVLVQAVGGSGHGRHGRSIGPRPSMTPTVCMSVVGLGLIALSCRPVAGWLHMRAYRKRRRGVGGGGERSASWQRLPACLPARPRTPVDVMAGLAGSQATCRGGLAKA